MHEHRHENRECLTKRIGEQSMGHQSVGCRQPGRAGLLGHELPDPNENIYRKQQVGDERESPGRVFVADRNEHWDEPSTRPVWPADEGYIAWPVGAGIVRGTLMKPRILSLVPQTLGVLLLLTGVGCAGSNWDGRVFHSRDFDFRAGGMPAGWRRVEDENSLLTFRDAGRDLVITVSGRCGKDGDDVPLQALTQHLFMYFTERQVIEERPVTLDDREALRTELFAKLDGVPRHFVVYVLKKNGCVYDFILIAAPAVDAPSKSEFDQFVLGFSTQSSDSRQPRFQVQ